MRPGVLAAVVITCGWGAAAVPTPAAQDKRATLLAPPGSKPVSFEVASVKPNNSGARTTSAQILPGGRFTLTNYPLQTLIILAYSLQQDQLVNVPDWASSERFDINAKAEGDFTTTRLAFDDARLMMRVLLAERFGLVIHEETRNLDVYALVPDREDRRLGANMRAASCEPLSATDVAGGTVVPCGNFTGNPATGAQGRGLTMGNLARFLQGIVGMMVVDRTGLEGTYDLTLTFERNTLAANSELPSIFTAIQEQLGLRLRRDIAPVAVIVVDRVDRPTPD